MERSKDDGVKLVAYTYDGAGRLQTVTETPKNSESATRTATYSYDNSGNRTSLVEMCSGTENVNGKSVSYTQKTTEYLYSKVNVITLESEIYQNAEGSQLARKNTRYVYDKAGNQISETAGVQLGTCLFLHILRSTRKRFSCPDHLHMISRSSTLLRRAFLLSSTRL